MVSALHSHGLEVVMDVVYNHTPEGNEFGPTLSFRGLDNASWYRLVADDCSRSENLTGCGNTMNVAHPRITQFVLDSLRYWVEVMGVDGFRFDLAPVLGRTRQGFETNAAFFVALRQDPILSSVHLIAEPWDAGPNGYQVGRFPGRFLEWNDKFRDTVRGYWLGSGVGRGEFARRFTASSDLFNHAQRRPSASVNFVSVHDGFTLADWLSYSRKHNEANGEQNRDGRDGERCANFGVEGPTDDIAINAQRMRVRRAVMATLLLAQGTPMLNAGDEIGNSQQGNNNAYCQDNAVGWINWPDAASVENEFKKFVADVIALRKAEPSFTHDNWFVPHPGTPGERSLVWFTPAGSEMQIHDWHDSGQHAFACRIEAFTDDAQYALGQNDRRQLIVLFNPETTAELFTLDGGHWEVVLDTGSEIPFQHALPPIAQNITVGAQSLIVLRSHSR